MWNRLRNRWNRKTSTQIGDAQATQATMPLAESAALRPSQSPESPQEPPASATSAASSVSMQQTDTSAADATRSNDIASGQQPDELVQDREKAHMILANNVLMSQMTPAGQAALRDLLVEQPTPQQIERGRAALRAITSSVISARIEGLPDILRTWYGIRNWTTSRLWLAEHLDEVPPDALALLNAAAERARTIGDDQGMRLLALHETLLREARDNGVDAAYRANLGERAFIEENEAIRGLQSSLQGQQLVEWVRMPDLNTSHAYLKEHVDTLLTDQAEKILTMLADIQPSDRERRSFTANLHLLQVARARGIDAAYTSLIQEIERHLAHQPQTSPARYESEAAEIDALLPALQELTSRNANLARQEELCRRILQIDRQAPVLDPRQRSTVWETRGNALLGLAQRSGGQAHFELLREAIACYDAALQWLRREVGPSDWAACMVNKGSALDDLADNLSGAERVQALQEAIACFDQALLEYRRDNMPPLWAITLNKKGAALSDLADCQAGAARAQALRDAITCYDDVLRELRREVNPRECANTLNSKGVALRSLAEGLDGEAQERVLRDAVACFDNALQESRREVAPLDWAQTLNNKGITLWSLADALGGDARLHALQDAIACFDDALLECRREIVPLNWGMTLSNKGSIFLALAGNLSGAARDQALRDAIACFDDALLECRREIAPHFWAIAINNKGIALDRLAKSLNGATRAQALREAMNCFDSALLEYRRETAPLNWATTVSNKGNALQTLAENLQGAELAQIIRSAIACYDNALLEIRRELAPLKWAMLHTNKGNALKALAKSMGGKQETQILREAITCYDNALLEVRRGVAPADWALTLNNKGVVLDELAAHLSGAAREQALREAVAAYDQVLLERTREVAPFDWASTWYFKGNALVDLASGLSDTARAQTLEEAAAAYRKALTVYSPELHPVEYRRVVRELVSTYLLQGSMTSEANAGALEHAWQEIASGISAAEYLELRESSLVFRQQEWSENASLYNLAACVQALRGHADEAVTLIERGRARGLAEAAGRRNADLSLLASSDRDEYLAALQRVQDIEAASRQGGDPLALVAEARAANERLAAVVARLRAAYPNFLPKHDVSISALTSGLRSDEALVYLIPQQAGTLTLAIARDTAPRLTWLTGLTSTDIMALAVTTDEQGINRLGFLPAALGWIRDDPIALVRALDELLPQLGDRLMRTVVEMVRGCACQHAVLVPSGFLSVLPLHAASYEPLAGEPPTAPNGRRYACDDLAMTYAPSGLVFLDARRNAARQMQTRPARQVFIAGNPQLTRQDESWTPSDRGYLRYAEWEARRVAALAAERTPPLIVDLALNEQATWRRMVEGLGKADVAHLALHAVFEYSDPKSSAFLVAFRAQLMLRDLLDPRQAHLAQLRLVVLSACQSALADFNRQSEEAVGLFGALLAGGVPGVIGTLWSVNDLATAALMESFARRYFVGEQAPDAALLAATRDIRGMAESSSTATTVEPMPALRRWEELAEGDPKAVGATRLLSPDELATIEQSVRIFRLVPREHPVYWAAFVFHGASLPLDSGASVTRHEADEPLEPRGEQLQPSGDDEIPLADTRAPGYFPAAQEVCPRCHTEDYIVRHDAQGRDLRECVSCQAFYRIDIGASIDNPGC